MRVVRFRYLWPDRAQQLADGAILPNLRRNRWLWLQVPPFMLAELIAAWRYARQTECDVIHAHWVIPQGVIALALRLTLRRPILVTSHGADLYALRGRFSEALKRRVLGHADATTAVSRSLRQEQVRLGAAPERTAVVPMGVDRQRFRPDARSEEVRARLNPDGAALLFVGRLAEKKGARFAIEAMPRILADRPSARLTIAGDGPDRSMLEALTTRLQLTGHVQFLGPVSHAELPALYASADLTLVPSVRAADGDTEAYGLVIAEAMACGCPVIASDVGGVSDLVVDGATGLLVQERDATALAAAVLRLLADPALRDWVTAGGLRRAREVDRAPMAEQYRRILEAIAR
jgi:glycosyltransferase involved in cell wall biosynthesis